MSLSVTVQLHAAAVVACSELRAVPGLYRKVLDAFTVRDPDWRPGSPTPEFIECFQHLSNRSYLRLPRGGVVMLRELCGGAGVTLVERGGGMVSRSRGARPLRAVDPLLRDYQRDCAAALVKAGQGVAELPTGAGKTRTASAAAVALGEPTIVFTHTDDLLAQWVEAFRNLKAEPRVIAGSASNFAPLRPGEVAVAMIPTVARCIEAVMPLLTSAGCVVVDEAQHSQATTWAAVVSACPARYRWGLSATKAEDGRGAFADLLFGPTVFKVRTSQLIERGILRNPRVLPIATGWAPTIEHRLGLVRCEQDDCLTRNRAPWPTLRAGEARCKRCGAALCFEKARVGPLDYNAAQSALISSPRVLGIVVALTQHAADAGRMVLVLVPRRSATKAVAGHLRQRGIPAVGVSSHTRKDQRRAALEVMRRSAYRALIATTFADEGLDIKPLDFGINCMSGRKQGITKQRAGRLLRLDGADPIMIELVHGGEYDRQWPRRRAAYEVEYGAACLLASEPVSLTRAATLLEAAGVPVSFASVPPPPPRPEAPAVVAAREQGRPLSRLAVSLPSLDDADERRAAVIVRRRLRAE